MQLIFRPIDIWPGKPTPTWKRQRGPFKATWSDTLELLQKELHMIGVREAVIQVSADERAMRLDGGLRADAKVKDDGCIINFNDRQDRPLQFATDIYTSNYRGNPGWQMNARAIAKSLEALRMVDRYGITQRGEQYTGFAALGQGDRTTDWAAGFIAETTGDPHLGGFEVLQTWPESGRSFYRQALLKAHPDHGGTPDAFHKLQKAKQLLDEAYKA